mgnify:CR=1 FL=1
MTEVRFTNIPAYGEIGVKYMYDKAMTLPGVKKYFPDIVPKSRTIDKQYFYNVFNTLYPDDVAALIKHANDQRYTVENDKIAENSIVMTEDWANQIEELPFVSKQKGRMAHLIKRKSKVSAEWKDRVTYEAHDFLKRQRGNPEYKGKGPINPQS